jgi:hypothetical protein
VLQSSAIPALVGILLGLLLALVCWGFLRTQGHKSESAQLGARDDLLLGLLMLAVFGLGVFLTYALLGFRF